MSNEIIIIIIINLFLEMESTVHFQELEACLTEMARLPVEWTTPIGDVDQVAEKIRLISKLLKRQYPKLLVLVHIYIYICPINSARHPHETS